MIYVITHIFTYPYTEIAYTHTKLKYLSHVMKYLKYKYPTYKSTH